jgi:hypothetical protein
MIGYHGHLLISFKGYISWKQICLFFPRSRIKTIYPYRDPKNLLLKYYGEVIDKKTLAKVEDENRHFYNVLKYISYKDHLDLQIHRKKTINRRPMYDLWKVYCTGPYVSLRSNRVGKPLEAKRGSLILDYFKSFQEIIRHNIIKRYDTFHLWNNKKVITI